MQSETSPAGDIPSGRPPRRAPVSPAPEGVVSGRAPVASGRPTTTVPESGEADEPVQGRPVAGRPVSSTAREPQGRSPRRSRGLLLTIAGLGISLCVLGAVGFMLRGNKVTPEIVQNLPSPSAPDSLSPVADDAAKPPATPNAEVAKSPVPPTQPPPNVPEPAEQPKPAPKKPPPATRRPPSEGPAKSAPSDWAAALGVIRIRPALPAQLDGVALVAAPLVPKPWTLVLPPGRHAISIDAAASESLAPTILFADWYQKQAEKYQEGDKWSLARLVDAIRPSGGAFIDPALAHWWGNYCWQEGNQDEALRHWKAAIRLEPSFAPAHLNLAFASVERKELPEAQRELALVDAFNPQNSCSLGDHLLKLRERLGFESAILEPPSFNPQWYDPPQEQPTAEERQVIGFYLSIAEYGHSPAVKAKALNNAGVYALQVAHKPQLALYWFQEAQAALARGANEAQLKELTPHLLKNLEAAAKEAKFTEAFLYARLQEYY